MFNELCYLSFVKYIAIRGDAAAIYARTRAQCMRGDCCNKLIGQVARGPMVYAGNLRGYGFSVVLIGFVEMFVGSA